MPAGVTHTSVYVSIRQHTSAYVSIREHTSAYVVCAGEAQKDAGEAQEDAFTV
jgi:hypothetical protein